MTLQTTFIHADWRPVFLARQLGSLEAWWTLAKDDQRATMVDDVNARYGGSSSVHFTQLDDIEGRARTLYIKCQQGQARRSLKHPLGRPTVHNEFAALRHCLALGIPVAEPLFFDTSRDQQGNTLTLMVTLGLEGFKSLDEIDIEGLDAHRRRQLLEDVAATLAFMHNRQFVHRNLYPKHVLVNWRDSLARYEVRFIDMEKAHSLSREQHRFRDLDTLNRRTQGITDADRKVFFNRYLAIINANIKQQLLGRQLTASQQRSKH